MKKYVNPEMELFIFVREDVLELSNPNELPSVPME